jgi:hypothetical protein
MPLRSAIARHRLAACDRRRAGLLSRRVIRHAVDDGGPVEAHGTCYPRWRALNDHSALTTRMTFQAADGPAKQLQDAREWSSPICGSPVSGQPPAVIFCVQAASRAADRTPQQRLGV